jgi:hypothetical protein
LDSLNNCVTDYNPNRKGRETNMKKLVIALFLVLVTLTGAFAVNTSFAATTPTITVDPATQQFPSAHVGDKIQINITISNAQNLWLWEINGMEFNPAMLSLTNLTEGPFLQQAGATMFLPSYSSYQTNQGLIADISDALLEQAGSTGSGVLATLTFTVLSTGTSQITFNQTNLMNKSQIGTSDTIDSTAINANINVGTGGPSSTSTSSPSPTPTSSNTLPPTTAPSNGPGNTATANPTNPTSTSDPHTGDNSVPEFPVLPILIALIIAASFSILVATKRKVNAK